MVIQTGQTRLILASASPRRRELLLSVGLKFDVRPPDIDETRREYETPGAYVERLAREKAAAVHEPGSIALAADTTVVAGQEVLGKPTARDDARRMLNALSGNEHSVLTGVAVHGDQVRARVVETRVRFRALSADEIAWYSHTAEPMDKAGAYAIQGTAGMFVESIRGSHSNVIGLPLSETVTMLIEAGLRMPWGGG